MFLVYVEPDSSDLTWVIPASILPSVLSADILLIDKFIQDPLDASNGKSIKDLLQARKKARAVKPRRAQLASSSSDEAAAGGEEGGAPLVGADGEIVMPRRKSVRKEQKSLKRGRTRVRSREVREESDKSSDLRAKKRADEAAAYKSAQFVCSFFFLFLLLFV